MMSEEAAENVPQAIILAMDYSLSRQRQI